MSGPAPRARRALEGDVEALVAIENACFADGPYRRHGFDAAQFGYYLRNPQAIVLVTTKGGRAVASLVALAGRGARLRSGRILSIAVLPRFRRQMLGRRLLTRALTLLRERGCRRIHLETSSRALEAEEFFKAFGFHAIRRLPNHYGRFKHGTRMMLELN